jgi:translation initiation factor 1 (eIF-1/SUI1)
MMTRVNNLQAYNLNLDVLKLQWQKKFASSTSLGESITKKSMDILIQGSWSQEVELFLIADCYLPKTSVSAK